MNFQILKIFVMNHSYIPNCPDFNGKCKTGVLSIDGSFFNLLICFLMFITIIIILIWTTWRF